MSKNKQRFLSSFFLMGKVWWVWKEKEEGNEVRLSHADKQTQTKAFVNTVYN